MRAGRRPLESRGATLLRAGLVWLGVTATAAPLTAQDATVDPADLLQRATVNEQAGDLEGAASLLGRLLDHEPVSVQGLVALERVLRVQGDLESLEPRVRVALEREPGSALLNELLVRTLVALDRPEALQRAADAWIRETPEVEAPYRVVAAAWRERGEVDRARRVLEQGRNRVPRRDALALELGELYGELGDPASAAREWDRAVGQDAAGLVQVRRRLRALPDGGASVLEPLVERLSEDPDNHARIAGAVQLAVDAGMAARAQALATTLIPAMSAERRSRFFSGLARSADAAGLTRLAHWSYSQLLHAEEQAVRSSPIGRLRQARSGDVQGDGRLVAIRDRLDELSAELDGPASHPRTGPGGDTTQDPEAERRAAARAVEARIERGLDSAVVALRAFREQYPDAPEEDALAAAVGAAVSDAGRPDEAELLIRGIRGPETSELRARLALAQGELDVARSAFMAAAAFRTGPEATALLGLARLMGRLDEPGGVAVGAALADRDAGDTSGAVRRLEASLPSLPPDNRPPLLELAARLADEAGSAAEAERLRRRVIAEHPESAEAPAAMLAVALSARQLGDAGEARELLERLIIEHPRSALVPQARRVLESLPDAGEDAVEEAALRSI